MLLSSKYQTDWRVRERDRERERKRERERERKRRRKKKRERERLKNGPWRNTKEDKFVSSE